MHKMTTSSNKENDVMTAIKRPKRATIEFLKQFARAYQYNAELPRGLESMIVNRDNPVPLQGNGSLPARHDATGRLHG